MFASLAPARRRLLRGLIGLVLAAGIAGVAVAIARDVGSDSPAAAAQDMAGPVLLVPGYGGSTRSLAPLAASLRAAGKDVTVVSLPDNALGDLDVQAVALAAAAAAARSRTGAPSVDVVGYSAGGVVVRLWIRDHRGAAVVRRAITLGSPHHGTALADLGTAVPEACPVACQQLATGSPVLDALNRDDETPSGPTWLSIWTERDSTVLPPDSARLDGATNITVQSRCPADTVDHSGLPADAVVQQLVLAQLTTGDGGKATVACLSS